MSCKTTVPDNVKIFEPKMLRWAAGVAGIGEITFIGRLQGKRLFERSRLRWKNYIKMYYSGLDSSNSWLAA